MTDELREIWTPLAIGPMRVKHRIMMTPHGQLYGENNVPSDRHIAYYRERAKGGAALLGVEATAPSRHTIGGLQKGMTAWEKRSIPAFAKLADAVHEYDCRIVVELASVGVNDRGRTFIDDWHPAYGPSRVPSPFMNEIPVVMDQELIDEMVADFGQSALHMKVAGMDGVEIHAAHGYLLMQFLSPAYNKRSDRYGGSAESRCRLSIEIARSIRERVGSDMALGMRLSFDEYIGEAGVTPELSEEYLGILSATGLFDYFSISCAGYNALHYAVPPMGFIEEGYLVPYAAGAREIVKDGAKVMVVGRIKNLRMAEQVIRTGAADMVALLRAQIAEPHLVKKTQEGREDEIVQCTGGNECITAVFWNRELTCTVNPVVGRERQWGDGTLVPAERSRRVLVAGGGPAGMRVAATAASRGHTVTLVEKAPELGGHLNLLKRLPTRDDWQLAIDNLIGPLEKRGVDVRLGARADGELVAEERPDAVVCATGSTWDRTGFTSFRPERESIPGVEHDHVLDVATAAERALADPRSLGDKVVILDDTGTYLPVGLAELLANAGADVELMSRHLILGEDLAQNLELGIVFPRPAAAGVRLRPQEFIERIDGHTVEAYSIWGAERRVLEDIDHVVLAMLRTPVDDLYRELDEGPIEVHRIGDALAPRRPAEAIYEGEKLGRAL